MADRAIRPEDPARDVFDLDQDERWQARLAEARARREIALREKANLEDAPKRRPKPWEVDGQGTEVADPVEPVLEPEEDDRLDFSDRVKTLREKTERTGGNGGPPVEEPATEPDAGRADPRVLPEDAAPVETASRPRKVAARYLKRLAPDFEPSKPFVPEVGTRYEVASPPAVAPVLREAPVETRSEQVAEVARPVTTVPDEAAVATEARRRGMPLVLLGAVCALAVLPFTETVAPLIKGPPVSAASPAFGLEPALGIMKPMNAFPRNTMSWEWVPELNRATAGPLAVPLHPAPVGQRSVAALPSVAAIYPGLGDLALPGAASAEPWIALSPLPEPTFDRLPGSPEEAAAASADAAPVAAPDPKPEPVAPLTRLRVTILVPESADAAMAERMAAEIRARGHEIGSIKPVDLKISARNIRYFHAGDRGEAARLAEAYGARLRDFTSFRPAPNEGTVEIWLSGDVLAAPAPAPPELVAPQPPAVQPQIIVVTRPASFLDRLSDALWGGHSGSGLPAGSGGDDGAGIAPISGGSAASGSGSASVSGANVSTGTAGSATSGKSGNSGGSRGQSKKDG